MADVKLKVNTGRPRGSRAARRLRAEKKVPGVWAMALPEGRRRWSVHFLPPVPPTAGDSAASLTERYLTALEEMIRRHPAHWTGPSFE